MLTKHKIQNSSEQEKNACLILSGEEGRKYYWSSMHATAYAAEKEERRNKK